ncbi:MAG: hypothetical protein IJ112_04840 [Oscillospiraceae bacterium]|nr:hypothetical protein [Oscillospiraceae bacterium]
MDYEKQAFINFLRPKNQWLMVVFGGLCLLCAVLALVAGGGFISLLFLIPGGLLPYVAVREQSAYRNWVRSAESSGALTGYLEDFRAAEQVANGNIRFGRQYLYARNAEKVIAYGDVLQVYQRVHKTNFVESSRNITAVVRDGDKTKEVALCQLALRGMGDEVVRDVVGRLLYRNPSIKVGYK